MAFPEFESRRENSIKRYRNVWEKRELQLYGYD